jgi:putative membrane protein
MLTISNKNFYVWNAVITLAAMTFLTWLLFFRQAGAEGSAAVSQLPAVNATLNATSTVILLIGYWAIKSRREVLHKNLMISAFIVSALFLISYVYYHSQQGDTKFLGEGWIRPVYFFILITHIVLSMIVFPMVLSTIYFGLTDKRLTHRKIARITLPIWLYVSATGVIIFFMLRYNS